jgi:hypothetical protein
MAFQERERIFQDVATGGFHGLDAGGVRDVQQHGDFTKNSTGFAADGDTQIALHDFQASLDQNEKFVVVLAFLDQEIAGLEALLGQVGEQIEDGITGHTKSVADSRMNAKEKGPAMMPALEIFRKGCA